jgi:hypothetical protein
MDNEQIKSLLRFLVRRLRESKHEINVYRAVVMNLPDAFQEKVVELQTHYRASEEIEGLAKRDVAGFDELIEQLDGDQYQRAAQELLRRLELPEEPN